MLYMQSFETCFDVALNSTIKTDALNVYDCNRTINAFIMPKKKSLKHKKLFMEFNFSAIHIHKSTHIAWKVFICAYLFKGFLENECCFRIKLSFPKVLHI